MSRSLILLALSATLIVGPPASSGEAEPEPATRTMLNMRVVGAILTSYKEAHGKLPDLGSKPVESSRIVDELGTDLGTDLRKVLAATDGWGNPLRFIVTPDAYVIISFGADGREDVSYTELIQQRAVNVKLEPAPDSPDRDIIFVNGEFSQRPRPKATPTKQTMADLRMIATAIESFAVDTDKYPGPTKGLQPIDVFASALEPTYIRSLPVLDGWGHSYLVWSDTKTYFILCGGSDGVLDRDYLAPVDPTAALAKDSSTTADPTADIVFSNGQFVRWPKDGERP